MSIEEVMWGTSWSNLMMMLSSSSLETKLTKEEENKRIREQAGAREITNVGEIFKP
jgi:hypothetical protein